MFHIYISIDMKYLICLLVLALLVVNTAGYTATNYYLNVSLVSCGGLCPPGYPVNYQFTNAVNALGQTAGIPQSSPGVEQTLLIPVFNIYVGDTITVYTQTGIFGTHPFTICSGSSTQCMQAPNGNIVLGPMANTGLSSTYTFTTAGTYQYGCHVHAGFGATINVMSTGTGSAGVAPCAFYTNALTTNNYAVNEYTIIGDVVACAVYGSATGNHCGTSNAVAGILNTNSPILKFFNANGGTGAKYINRGGAPQSIDFTMSQSDFNTLYAHLVSLFWHCFRMSISWISCSRRCWIIFSLYGSNPWFNGS